MLDKVEHDSGVVTLNIIARELRADELELGLNLRNEIFSPITRDEWDNEHMTASIAFDGDKVIGLVPLALRKFKLASGISIVAAFENAVGTKEGYRSRGVGKAMIDAACGFLRGKADALFVYRADERSRGYNFYAKTGHVDLLSVRHFHVDDSIATIHSNVEVSYGLDEILKYQFQLLEVFEETYHLYGGFPERHENYWAKALSAHISIKPSEFYLFRLSKKGRLCAYILAGVRIDCDRLQILEMGACEKTNIIILLESAAKHASDRGLKGISIKTSDTNPFLEVFTNLNFIPEPRELHVMSLSFDPKSLFNKVWKNRLGLPGVKIKIATPKNEIIISSGSQGASQVVTLEMKEETFVKWIMGRIDFSARIREGTITAINASDDILERIGKAIPLNDWVYHHLDFI